MNLNNIEKKMDALNSGLIELKSNPSSGLLKDRLKKDLIVLYDMLGEEIQKGEEKKQEVKQAKKVESKSIVMEIKESLVDQLTTPISHMVEEPLEEEVVLEKSEELELEIEEDNSFDLFGEILYGEQKDQQKDFPTEQKEEEKIEEMTTFRLNKPMAEVEVEKEVEMLKSEEALEEEIEEELTFVEKVREPHADKLEEFRNLPIESLATTIPIGKKFEFIEDLFIGNSDEYSRAIKEIDSMVDFKNAEEYLMQNYFDKFGWMEKEKVLNNLFDFVNRRFAA